MERSVSAYDAGVSALNEARKIEEEQKARLLQIENQIEKNRVLQKELAEERLLLARDRVGSGKGGGVPKGAAISASGAVLASGAAVSAAASTASANLSAGEIIDRVDDNFETEEKTITEAIDSLLVDPTPSVVRDQQQHRYLSPSVAKLPHSITRSNVAHERHSSLNTSQNRMNNSAASATNDRFSSMLGAALGRNSNAQPGSAASFGSDEVLLSSFGQMGDASTTEAVLLLIEGQRENEYLKEEQKFLARLQLTNKKR